ncbi:acetate/propionate family kinase [Ectothiorhodospira lacustris]|uniref:acetate/propionate family kinase n=1 Tax=Ectothiorhodospira lacustris TaxID=2899127 RepID=UPI001EE81945|nr:acetate/propionate family kinase [Ectothiorhodospira lacustris]MCG5501393.1 acetate/propionate family kinase [Ectothiorhodospira lacustris]MCG5510151.1 acetate/propionate family kinase [Ectothiorhodospira lacustris]MCG5521994.1 acetate/propionate family kinase [Ectothiorhodospira lacustris]
MGDILVINSGSSSLKFALLGQGKGLSLDALAVHYQGHFSGLGGRQARLVIRDGRGRAIRDDHLVAEDGRYGHAEALSELLGWMDDVPDSGRISAIGHRIVHGGRHYRRPALLDEGVLTDLEALIPLAPLHQPHGLAPVRSLFALRPDVPQVACFDTSFHTTQAAVAQAFALPRHLTEAGLIRYGFHGLSYDYISRRLPEYLGRPETGRVVAAHLGNGASLCAMRDGASVASTMGFTALDGLPMGTRCGTIDPGVVLHLLTHENMTPEQVSDLLYKKSGLFGVSGISADMRDLIDNQTPSAREAVELFTYRIIRELGSHAAALGGLDHLVFTAGIGEHAAPVRAMVCRGCEWLGVRLDEGRNEQGELCISTDDSPVKVWVIPTDEERMIAWHTARCCP